MARLLQRLVASSANRPALEDDNGAWSSHQLDARVNQWMWALRERGLGRGDRVAFVAGNQRETFAALLACMHTGLVVVPVNWHLTATEIAYLLADSGCGAVICDEARLPVTAQAIDIAGVRPALRVVFGTEAGAGFTAAGPLLDRQPSDEPEEQESGAVMLYTSGTTGQPKGVITDLFLAGAQLARVTRLVERLSVGLGLSGPGRTLLVGPWYHSAQLFFSVFPLLAGSGLVVRARFDPEATLRDIDELHIAQCHLVPTQFIRLLRLDEQTRQEFSGRSLHRVWHGGGACPVEVKRQMIDWWGPKFTEYYAATEGGIVTLIGSREWLVKPGSVGQSVPPNHIVILSDDHDELPPHEEGLICVRRQQEQTFEYYKAPEKTRSAHPAPGVFTFGDRGYLDGDGFLYLTGRKSDMVISGGVNIYPVEIENVLLGHPAVRDAAVIGVPDEEFGERLHAVVALEPAYTGLASEELTASLIEFGRAYLAGFKLPRSYQIAAELPRDESGKLRKHLLRAEPATVAGSDRGARETL